jgi:hypothetical protein
VCVNVGSAQIVARFPFLQTDVKGSDGSDFCKCSAVYVARD